MATSSDESLASNLSGPTSIRSAILRVRALFSPDALSRLRSVLSVSLDIGRVIDKGLALWVVLGLPMWRHA